MIAIPGARLDRRFPFFHRTQKRSVVQKAIESAYADGIIDAEEANRLEKVI